MSRLQANALLLIAGAIWGMGFVAQAQAMDSVGPYLFIALRFFVACIVVLPFALLESSRHRSMNMTNAKRQLISIADVGKFSLIGLALFAGMACQQVGLLTTSVTNSGFLTGLYVVFTPLVAIALFRERPHPIIWPSAFTALVGIFFLSGGRIADLVIGDVLTILSALFWAIQLVLIARFVGQTARPLALSIVQFFVTAMCALLVAIVTESIVWADIAAAAPEILYTGVFASGVAFTLQVIGQRYTSAPQAAIFLSSEASFAALFAFIWLGERIGLIGLGGCLLIFVAMMLVELVPHWQTKRRHA